MQFKLLTTRSLGIHPQLQWLLYLEQMRAFIFGDETHALALPLEDPAAPVALPGTVADTGAVATHPCNLPIPRPLYEELSGSPWHGFRFLEYAAYDHAVDGAGLPVGDLLRTLVFGPDYGHYLLHPASGMVFSLRSGSITMLRSESEGFKSVAQTRTRGRAALAFAAHPTENLIAYGDNAGTFHAQRFDAEGFGKASKIVAKDRKASQLDFVRNGRVLVIGGMGYLETHSYDSGKFALLHQVAIPVRDFAWTRDGELVLVNQGLHGAAAYRYEASGFTKLGEVKPNGAVRQLAVSVCGQYLALSEQDSADISVYEISGD